MLEDLTVVVDKDQLNHGVMHLLQEELNNASALDNTHSDDASSVQKPLTNLYFEFYDPETNFRVNMYSRKQKVRITNELVQFLTNQDGISCKINGHDVDLAEPKDVEGTEATDEALVDDNA
jgi:DNA polymerase-3 subunit alpha